MLKSSKTYKRIFDALDAAMGDEARNKNLADLDALIDNYTLASRTIERLQHLWVRHTTHNHTLMGEAFDAFVKDHKPPLQPMAMPHDTDTVWPVGNNPPQPVPAIAPNMPSPTTAPVVQKIRDASETARVVRTIIADMVKRGELYAVRDDDGNVELRTLVVS